MLLEQHHKTLTAKDNTIITTYQLPTNKVLFKKKTHMVCFFVSGAVEEQEENQGFSLLSEQEERFLRFFE